MSANRFQVGLVQMAMSADPAENTAKAAARIAEAAGRGAQVICLPELFRTPYFCQSETHATFALAEQLGGKHLLDLVIEETHSCYLGDRVHRHDWGYGCGTCPACQLRAAGYAGFLQRNFVQERR